MQQVNRFSRYVLPGLAFKAVVIGGGYATGREIATFFLPSGAIGGLYGLLVSTAVWSVICAVTFLFALQTRTADYRSFFRALLGPFWRIYEIAYFLALVLLLAVFAAAAGAIGHAVLGSPPIIGTLLLMALIVLFAAYGNDSVERLFKYVSFLLYGTYALFVVLSFVHFGDRITNAFATGTVTGPWAGEGMTYAGYNIIGAIVILPVTRHLMGRKDALIAGLIAGPLAAFPAILFFICMAGYAAAIHEQVLPSDFLLERLHFPAFRILFQAMVFAALLESGTGGVHAINQRIAHAYQTSRGRELSRLLRIGITTALLFVAVYVAGEFGLVALIAIGYRWLAYTFILVYVLPIMTLGVWRILAGRKPPAGHRTSISPD